MITKIIENENKIIIKQRFELLSALTDLEQKSTYEVLNGDSEVLFYIVEKNINIKNYFSRWLNFKNFLSRFFSTSYFRGAFLSADFKQEYEFSKPLGGNSDGSLSNKGNENVGYITSTGSVLNGWIKVFNSDNQEIAMFERKRRLNYEITSRTMDGASVITFGNGDPMAEVADMIFDSSLSCFGIDFKNYSWTGTEKLLIIAAVLYLDLDVFESGPAVDLSRFF